MKKLLAFIVMAAVLVTPALASGEPAAEAPAAAQDTVHHVTVEVTKEATCVEKGLLTYYYDGAPYMTVETVATGEHTPSAPAASCTEAVVCTVCGTVLEPAAGHSYTYQYDAVQNADGSFASFGTWKCDVCGDVLQATEGNAAYYYGQPEAPSEAPAIVAAPAEEPAPEEAPAEEAPVDEATPADTAAEEASPADASAEPAPEGEASADPAAATTVISNPNYDPDAHNWGSIEIALVVVIVVVTAILMLSFGKGTPARKKDDD